MGIAAIMSGVQSVVGFWTRNPHGVRHDGRDVSDVPWFSPVAFIHRRLAMIVFAQS